METESRLSYRQALADFYTARRKAVLEEAVARLTGHPHELLHYDDVRRRLRAVESADRKLTEIPLAAIVGSVSRQKDFTRSLLPLRTRDRERWAKVKVTVEDLAGLPPIEVYQLGEAYFIIDGHHRASVARQLGATHIDAYVRPVRTRVPLTPGDDLEDVILKSEFAEFLAKTHLDELRPGADLRGTLPGEYQYLLEQISVHQYLRSLHEKREIPYDEAVAGWYDHVYLPIVQVMRSRNIVSRFADRTETDLYFWITDYQSRSEQELGWKVTPRDAALNLVYHYARGFRYRLTRFRDRVLDWLAPDPLEPPIPPGFWRQRRKPVDDDDHGLFDTLLVALPGRGASWNALEAALFLGRNEHAAINGLVVVAGESRKPEPRVEQIRDRFTDRCQAAGVEGRLAVEAGAIPRVIYERSFWVDLVVLPLAFPPPVRSLQRLGSGLRSLIRRSAAPLLLVPPNAATTIRGALLAYGGGRLADEALYMAAYLCLRFKMDLTVITIGSQAGELHQRARSYLESQRIKIVTYLEEQGDPGRAILNASESSGSDVILMGGYEGGLLKEMLVGSTVDHVLRGTQRMVMICR